MENNSNLSLKSLSSDEISKIEEFRKSNHTAVLAILFSDIVNSTFAAEKLGEQSYSKLRHIHDELFKKIMCRENAGIIIKEIGDSFLCVFAEPSTAVLRAVEFQRAIFLNKINLSDQHYTLTVKIGIHVGQVVVENSLALDIFGRHVNRAARIEAIAHGGQILTSQSIWENAVGWLKDNNEEKIGWLSYGKTKLKGIDERVDIFGFYPMEIGKLPAPKTIQKQKVIRTLLLLTVLFVLVVLSVFFSKKVIQNSNQGETTQLTNSRKPYYVQFNFSEIGKQMHGKFQNPIVDTLVLSNILLTQIITILNPDSVITESDLLKSFSKQGKLYIRHESNNSNDSQYFLDTLKFAGVIFIRAIENFNQSSDSIKLHIRMDMYPNEISTAVEREMLFSVQNNANDFRNLIQDMLMETRLWTKQGYVLTCNDSIVLFQITKEATLRQGATITFMHEYIGMGGMHQRLEDLEKQIAFHSANPKDSMIVKAFSEDYSEIKKGIAKSHSKGSWAIDAGLKGKVIELYDSTGKSTWYLNGKFPARPRRGDIIYLGF